jgi:hypothetical protein
MKKYFDIPDPMYCCYYGLSIIAKDRLFRRYVGLARERAINQSYFILSFDCDTQEDSKVVWDVHTRLTDMGVKPVYMVPGMLLEQASSVYQRIARTGAEFINHGYREHTFFDQDSGRYASCFFYDRLSRKEIEEDIQAGDKALRSVLGITPAGFRTPHFGTFQKRRDIRFIHAVLKKYNYFFSSSTVPYYGFRYGPLFDLDGIKEFPLSGSWSKPLSILDSWSCFGAADRSMHEQDYLREARDISAFFSGKKAAGILNFYADPSHIAGKEEFFEAVRLWKEAGTSTTYSGFLQGL